MSESDIPYLPAPPRAKRPVNIVVMGVAESGRTMIDMMLTDKLGHVYVEGGKFHTQANRDKQASGLSLDDADRQSWLKTIRDWIRVEDAVGHPTVVSCSALGCKYRDALWENGARIIFTHIAPPKDLNAGRWKRGVGTL